jgi:eukaryotic-like serine/threonine-protein kinase
MALLESQPPIAGASAPEPYPSGSRPARAPLSRVPGAIAIGGRYRVQHELGRGGMGVVYRVREVGSERELALKQLLVDQHSSQAQRLIALFEREFHVLAQLAHPHVIAVYDYGLDASGPYYTMELLDAGI